MLRTKHQVVEAVEKAFRTKLTVLDQGNDYVVVGIGMPGDLDNALLALTFRKWSDAEGFRFGQSSGPNGPAWNKLCSLHEQAS